MVNKCHEDQLHNRTNRLTEEQRPFNPKNKELTEEDVVNIFSKLGLKVSFKLDMKTLQTAFVHSSYQCRMNDDEEKANMYCPNGTMRLRKESYEKLEWLGDSVLEYVSRVHCYLNSSKETYNELILQKIGLVNGKFCAEMSDFLGLGNLAAVSIQHEEKYPNRSGLGLRKDLFESLIGAIWMLSSGEDRRVEDVERFILSVFEKTGNSLGEMRRSAVQNSIEDEDVLKLLMIEKGDKSKEKLLFLGETVFSFSTSLYIYRRYSTRVGEDYLSNMRVKMTNASFCEKLLVYTGLEGPCKETFGEKGASAWKLVLGKIWILKDFDLNFVYEYIKKVLETHGNIQQLGKSFTNPKEELARVFKTKFSNDGVIYETTPDEFDRFTSIVKSRTYGVVHGKGKGTTRKTSEYSAAIDALETL